TDPSLASVVRSRTGKESLCRGQDRVRRARCAGRGRAPPGVDLAPHPRGVLAAELQERARERARPRAVREAAAARRLRVPVLRGHQRDRHHRHHRHPWRPHAEIPGGGRLWMARRWAPRSPPGRIGSMALVALLALLTTTASPTPAAERDGLVLNLSFQASEPC